MELSSCCFDLARFDSNRTFQMVARFLKATPNALIAIGKVDCRAKDGLRSSPPVYVLVPFSGLDGVVEPRRGRYVLGYIRRLWRSGLA
jgi:hypothetical protein